MTLERIKKAVFLKRLNRFCAEVETDGEIHTVHVKNTGRLRELLYTGARVFLSEAQNPERKTKYDLVAVEKEKDGTKSLVSIDSSAPNTIAFEWMKNSGFFGKDALIRREVTHKSSRFDFYIEKNGGEKIFLEVKGCTLEENGIALFPDAPTERGVKHLRELMSCIDEGYGAYVLFVIQMKGVKSFTPNDARHPEFGKALREAKEKGVNVLAIDCIVTESFVKADSFVKIEL